MSAAQTSPDDTLVGLPARIGRFFFREEIPYGLAAVRIWVPLVLFGDMIRRWPYVRELFSADGATAPIYINYGLPNPVPEFPAAVAVALFTLMLVTLLTTAAGWMTRVSAAVAFTLLMYFNLLDQIGTVSKYTVIGCHALLLLAVSDCGGVWSVDAWRRGGARASAAWPRRLLQLLIGIIYFAASVTKMHTPEFFSGEQMLFWTLTHLNQAHPVGDELAMHPTLLIVSAFVTIVWEALFLFTCWRGVGRTVMLGLGVTFHAATCVVLGLYLFPLLFFGLYFAFLNQEDVATWKRRWRALALRVRAMTRSLPRVPTPHFAIPRAAFAPATFVFALPLLAGAGAVAEFAVDPYNARGEEGPMPLRPISHAEAVAMLGPTEEVRPVDKFFSFTAGDTMLGPYVLKPVEAYETGGGVLYAQAIFQPPHEDLWVECHVREPTGSVVARRSGLVPRDILKSSYRFELDETVPPGEYDIVLVLDGDDVATRRVTFTAPE